MVSWKLNARSTIAVTCFWRK